MKDFKNEIKLSRLSLFDEDLDFFFYYYSLTLNFVLFVVFCRCPYLHRTAGDTERRYHLRYYKTGTCVYETDNKGNCVKNGSHCAFAHGAHDLRPPIYDVRELQAIDTVTINCDKSSNASSVSGTPSSLEKDKILAEDPRWNGKFIYNCKLEVKACYIISVLAGI